MISQVNDFPELKEESTQQDPVHSRSMINGKTVYPKLPRRSERLKKLQEAQEARENGQLIRHCKAVQWLPLSHYGLESKVVDVDTIMGTESDSGMDPDLFQPAPKTWKQILTLPIHLKSIG